MPFVSKEDILTTRGNLKTQVVSTPEWAIDGEVLIIELSGKQRDAFEASMVVQATKRGQLPGMNMRNVRARLVAKCVVDPSDFDAVEETVYPSTIHGMVHEDGVLSKRYTLKPNHTPKRVFSDFDVDELGEVSAAALDRVFDACQKLSGITESDVVELTGELKNEVSEGFGSN